MLASVSGRYLPRLKQVTMTAMRGEVMTFALGHRMMVGIRRGREIAFGDLGSRAFGDDPPAVEQNRAVAERGDHARVVAHDDHRMSSAVQLLIARLAPEPESGVADGEDLVQHEHVADRAKRHRVS